MSLIKNRIETVNNKGKKALSIFLTAGFPNRYTFMQTVDSVIESGADLIEIGVPFGDSLADGPVVQSSYNEALKQNVTIIDTLNYISTIKKNHNIPIILMSSANPLFKLGVEEFVSRATDSSVDGLIIPDIPLEEHKDFFDERFNGFDKILLTTPTSSEARIQSIDNASEGFVYCVSVVGTTGVRQNFSNDVFSNLKRTYASVKKNKMLIGFGIKNSENIKQFSPYCDGVIVGSAIIKSLENDDDKFSNTSALIKELKSAC